MSENISLPAARIPLVDGSGRITREWMAWFIGMFRRAGGTQGFSNQELAGDVAAQQGYNELLERISALEAMNRDLARGMQILAMSQFDQAYSAPPSAVSPDTFARIKVLGETDLATDGGRVRVGRGVPGSTAKLQVGGDAEISGGARVRGALQVDGEMGAAAYRVSGVKVVGGRVAGIPAFTAYAGQTMGAAYNRSQAQTTDDTLKALSAVLAKVVTALREHGLIGD